jgi:hypothetical protein
VAPDSACNTFPPLGEKCIWYHAQKLEVGTDTQNTCTIVYSCIGFEPLVETDMKCSQMTILWNGVSDQKWSCSSLFNFPFCFSRQGSLCVDCSTLYLHGMLCGILVTVTLVCQMLWNSWTVFDSQSQYNDVSTILKFESLGDTKDIYFVVM